MVGCSSIWRDKIAENLPETLRKVTTFVDVGLGGREGIDELFRKRKFRDQIKELMIAEEVRLVDDLMQAIGREGNVCYGYEECKKAAEYGAVERLLVSTSFIRDKVKNKKYGEVEGVMVSVEKSGGEVHIINSRYESGKRLDGVGGIAAFLRYKLE